MKKFLLFCAALCTGFMSIAQLNQVVVEPYTLVGGGVQPAGTTTYRIYAEMVQANDLVSAVYAIQDCHPLDISTTTTFHNDIGFGSTTAAGINPGLFGFFPDLEADSWVTIGGADQTAPGMGTDLFVAFTIPADPVTPATGAQPGGNLVAEDGAWFSLATSPLVVPSGPNNRVLLGQFTTDGDLSYNINLQCFLNGDQANRVDYVYDLNCNNGGTPTGFESFNASLTFPQVAVCNDTEVTVDMTDSFGDGWNGTIYEVFDNADPLNPVLVASGDLDNAASGDLQASGQDVLCLPDGCYTLAVTGSNGAPNYIEETGVTLTGVDGGPLSSGPGNTANYTIDFSINTVCQVFGCTDPAACNFNPVATDDDGSCILPPANDLCADAIDLGSATTTVSGSNVDACQDNEIGEASGVFYSFTLNADADVTIETTAGGDTQLAVFENCGDASPLAFNDDGGVGLLSQLSFGCGALVAGQTYIIMVDGFGGDQFAFDLALTIDENACNPCTDNPVTFDMTDDFGDGWNGATYTITDYTDLLNPVVVATGDLDGADVGDGVSIGTDNLCLLDGCYLLEVSEGGFPEEIQWTLSGVDGGPIVSDPIPNGAPASVQFSINNGACPPIVLGCTDPTACNYDMAANVDDGSCTFICNDLPGGAIAIAVDPLGTCNGVTGEDITAATVAAPEGQAFTAGSGNDLWYSFVAPTPGARIEVICTDFDAVIELQDAANNLIDIEDAVFVNGGEIYNVGNLVAGDTYLIRVAAYFDVTGPALFDICVQSIPDTRCDYGAGPYDLCNVFKADWVGADDYIFNFTDQGTGDFYSYQQGGPNTFLLLADAGLPYDAGYDVAINSVFNLTDGNGNVQEIIVENDEPCTLTMNPQPVTQLRASDNQANFGAHFLGGYVGATPFVCGVVEWEWNFVNTDGTQLPVTYLSGSSNRFIQLSAVGALQEGAVYETSVRPVFAGGAGSFGPIELLAIVGPAEIVEIESPVVLADDAERLDIVEMSAATIYPNPNNGEVVNVNITDIPTNVDRVAIDIFDVAGKLVASQQIPTTGTANLLVQMPLNDLNSGMYLVNITVDGAVTTERLTISK